MHGGAWDERRGQAEILVGAAGRRSLRLLRAALLDETDVLVDPRYVASLRLFRHTDAGRRAVDGEEVRAVAARHGVGGLDVVPGRRWTTVLVAGASPVTALDRLRAGASPAPPLHVVAGGTADMDLLPAAAGRHAPASVEPAFRARAEGLGVRIASRPYQAGLLQAVDAAVHRSGGSCERCRRLGPRRLEAADAALLTALGLQDRGRVGRAAFLLRPTAGAGR